MTWSMYSWESTGKVFLLVMFNARHTRENVDTLDRHLESKLTFGSKKGEPQLKLAEIFLVLREVESWMRNAKVSSLMFSSELRLSLNGFTALASFP